MATRLADSTEDSALTGALVSIVGLDSIGLAASIAASASAVALVGAGALVGVGDGAGVRRGGAGDGRVIGITRIGGAIRAI